MVIVLEAPLKAQKPTPRSGFFYFYKCQKLAFVSEEG